MAAAPYRRFAWFTPRYRPVTSARETGPGTAPDTGMMPYRHRPVEHALNRMIHLHREHRREPTVSAPHLAPGRPRPPRTAPVAAEGAGRVGRGDPAAGRAHGLAGGGRAGGVPRGRAGDSVGDVVRWGAFSCVLVPVVPVWYGTSSAGAAGTALGLAAVTGACHVLLRQSERGAARLRAEERVPHRGRHHRTGTGAHRGGRHPGGTTPVT